MGAIKRLTMWSRWVWFFFQSESLMRLPIELLEPVFCSLAMLVLQGPGLGILCAGS
jgi:hypothetical protein